MANTAHVMQNIATDPTTKTRIEFLSRLTQEELDALNEFYPATPRPWVGLTADQQQTAIWTDGTFGAGALWAETKLRENNT